MKILIIGAGMAGLSCAAVLKSAGHQVVLHDKGRGPGGRMSTRRAETPQGEISFDHGAQYFKSSSEAFAAQCALWLEQGAAAYWPGAGKGAMAGTPGMNAPIKAMAAEHEVHWNSLITGLEKIGTKWKIKDAESEIFDAVIIAVPAEQVAALAQPWDNDLAEAAGAVISEPSWTLMLGFDRPVPGAPDVVRSAGPLAWAARNNAKPGRENTETWVVQASAKWSQDNLERDKDDIAAELTAMFSDAVGGDLPEPFITMAHRWRYAQPGTAAPLNRVWNGDLDLGVCGDWTAGNGVENAWISGHRLAHEILRAE